VEEPGSELISAEGGVQGQQLAVIHDPHAVGQLGGLVHVVGGEEQRHPARLELTQGAHTNRRAAGSRPVEGSSRNRTWGSCMSARAIITRWAWPPENMSGLT
jgi:hypothetical protein